MHENAPRTVASGREARESDSMKGATASNRLTTPDGRSEAEFGRETKAREMRADCGAAPQVEQVETVPRAREPKVSFDVDSHTLQEQYNEVKDTVV